MWARIVSARIALAAFSSLGVTTAAPRVDFAPSADGDATGAGACARAVDATTRVATEAINLMVLLEEYTVADLSVGARGSRASIAEPRALGPFPPPVRLFDLFPMFHRHYTGRTHQRPSTVKKKTGARHEGRSRRLTRNYTQTIRATPERVFPLLCPVREREWVEGWECRLVYSASGVAEGGCVFTTPQPGGPETVWVVADYEPPRRIRFVRITPRETAVEIEIEVSPQGSDESAVAIRYTYVSLGPRGDRRIDAITEEAWRTDMELWERSMNHFLATGEMLASARE
jgi:hypothetical protein